MQAHDIAYLRIIGAGTTIKKHARAELQLLYCFRCSYTLAATKCASVCSHTTIYGDLASFQAKVCEFIKLL